MLHHHQPPAAFTAPCGAVRLPGSACVRSMGRYIRRGPGSSTSARDNAGMTRERSLACAADASSAGASSTSPARRQPGSGLPGASSAPVTQVDFLVLGSGIAGLTYALKVAEYGSVAVVTKAHANEGCTQYAQGGVCAVLDVADSVESHVEDTMIAGAFLNNRKCVCAPGWEGGREGGRHRC